MESHFQWRLLICVGIADLLVEMLQKVSIAVVALLHLGHEFFGRGKPTVEIDQPIPEKSLRGQYIACRPGYTNGGLGFLVARVRATFGNRFWKAFLFHLVCHRNIRGVNVCIGNSHVHTLC